MPYATAPYAATTGATIASRASPRCANRASREPRSSLRPRATVPHHRTQVRAAWRSFHWLTLPPCSRPSPRSVRGEGAAVNSRPSPSHAAGLALLPLTLSHECALSVEGANVLAGQRKSPGDPLSVGALA